MKLAIKIDKRLGLAWEGWRWRTRIYENVSDEIMETNECPKPLYTRAWARGACVERGGSICATTMDGVTFGVRASAVISMCIVWRGVIIRTSGWFQLLALPAAHEMVYGVLFLTDIFLG